MLPRSPSLGQQMQFNQLRRREFITLLGGTAATWPLATRAQQPAMPVVGYLWSGAADPTTGFLAAFQQGLGQLGYVEGRNVGLEYRWAEGQSDRLPALAADLVRRQVAVIAAVGGSAPAQAAKAITTAIPIVFVSGDDPVEAGLVSTLSRPGGNVTGISWIASALEAKRLGLLHEVAPKGAAIAVLVNPDFPGAKAQLKEAEEAARERGLRIQVLKASSERDLDAIFATLVEQRAGSLLVSPNPLFIAKREQIVALAARHRIPTIYYAREYVVAGGLMSYGTNVVEAFRQAGIYTGRILKGDKPADLPVWQPTKFEFVINLKTARTLGLAFPPGVLAIADEVIE
jgi:putative tryptophan/tyrosine transport system substrate-binding protein